MKKKIATFLLWTVAVIAALVFMFGVASILFTLERYEKELKKQERTEQKLDSIKGIGSQPDSTYREPVW